jgi:hypothetical protein
LQATARNFPSLLILRQLTWALKLKFPMATFLGKFIKRQYPSKINDYIPLSTRTRVRLSGVTSKCTMLDLVSIGKVLERLFFKSKQVTLLPTGESKISSVVNFRFPVLYMQPSKLEN